MASPLGHRESGPTARPKPKRQITPEHRAALLRNLRKAWTTPRNRPFVFTRARRRVALGNLEKAHAAAKLKPPAYVLTARRLESARENIRRANASPRSRGQGFRHGLAAASMRGTLALAGESEAAFNAHLKRFVLAFASPEACRPEAPAQAIDPGDVRLVRGAAELLWRRLRAFRSLGRWERRALAKTFERHANGGAVTAERATDFALELLVIFLEFAQLLVHVFRLNRRLEDIFRELLARRFGHDPDFRIFRRTRHKRPRLAERPPEIIGNPLKAPKGVAATLARAPQSSGHPRSRGSDARPRGRGASFPEPGIENPQRLARALRRALLPSGAKGNRKFRRQLRRAAEALRGRLEFFPHCADWEARRVKGTLNVARKSAPLSEQPATSLARRILESFDDEQAILREVPKLNTRLTNLLVGLLKQAHGDCPAFKAFSPPQEFGD